MFHLVPDICIATTNLPLNRNSLQWTLDHLRLLTRRRIVRQLDEIFNNNNMIFRCFHFPFLLSLNIILHKFVDMTLCFIRLLWVYQLKVSLVSVEIWRILLLTYCSFIALDKRIKFLFVFHATCIFSQKISFRIKYTSYRQKVNAAKLFCYHQCHSYLTVAHFPRIWFAR